MNFEEVKEDREHCYAGVEYEQEELIDWLITEVDQLRKENQDIAELFNAQAICAEQYATVMADNAMLRTKITMIANIVHHGGLIGFKDECSAQNEIRKITLPYWDKKAADKLQGGKDE